MRAGLSCKCYCFSLHQWKSCNDCRMTLLSTQDFPTHPLFYPVGNQIYLVTLRPPQLTKASFLQKNQMLQNGFLIFLTLRWHSGVENHEIWTRSNLSKKNFIEEYQFRATFFFKILLLVN